ncbi:D-alanine--D-alanine ligase [Candidatus Vesicomyidisocius calyptogenae]|uniref:D-alanine--D-alanine ligase n=1 Tax=Vesicomyosocius okutanii subsp. Calyptogena okutanii (strain HA) TaxID=412965 RepID=DDL_VESOH|nr:D-alanine--D-alanine ligase [Candidatus Vesicomyosocius okutanii]A5CW55.1 RecName: Full=D-alanine--D-alanine ligase; AltName: Full=D-Ala-D-Ala ligase; AltName: Full=D-alanylalanine synthetase [Candidatus Vesicomyosocius okutanii]BAF61813.1 D-alanine-D-alanine ligase B [Candidatus Vesicomyosocius okutanii]
MIAILMGGNSAERAISLKSGEAIYQTLNNQNIDCFTFDWYGDNLSEFWQQEFDQVFIILHGRGGEDGYIQKQLENRGICYTGSDSNASHNSMDKARTKIIWEQHSLTLAPSIIANIDQPINPINFPLPWAVKPTLEGSSIGISKVDNQMQLNDALMLAWQYAPYALIEQWIKGDEYTVAILGDKALPVVRIITDQNFYDYESKYHSNKTQYLCPCNLSLTQEKALQAIALKAFFAINAKGWGRVDFIINQHNKPYLLEINTVPGMTSHSLVPMAAKAIGISFNKLVTSIINEI